MVDLVQHSPEGRTEQDPTDHRHHDIAQRSPRAVLIPTHHDPPARPYGDTFGESHERSRRHPLPQSGGEDHPDQGRHQQRAAQCDQPYLPPSVGQRGQPDVAEEGHSEGDTGQEAQRPGRETVAVLYLCQE